MNYEVLSYALYSSLAFIGMFMSLFYLYSLVIRRADIADSIWGIGFIGVAWLNVYFFSMTPRSVLLAALVTLWGLRLATHVFMRNHAKTKGEAHAKGEDFRYVKWREEWGRTFWWRSYLQIFLLQGVLMWLICMPIMLAAADSEGAISWLTVIGVLTWVKGFVYEALGDYQLSRFIANPANKGKIMTQGLWSLTRHPNYFGEVTQWWGIYIVALPASVALWGWLSVVALIGPLTITFLILKVSGIPMLEKKYEGNADFEAYKKRTNAFFPWFPKVSKNT